jgi:hypothetical protein
MKPSESLQAVETFCKRAFLLLLLLSGAGVVLVVLSTGRPAAPGEMRIDYDFEITSMRLILNAGLPLALLAAGFLAWAEIRGRVIHIFADSVVVLSLVITFACALAAWSNLVAIHGKGAHLWSLIWWSLR